jgi:hypothetical protein
MGGRALRPRGYKVFKQDQKCDASLISLQKTLNGLIAEKEEENAQRDETKRR